MLICMGKKDYPKLHTFNAENTQFMWNAATVEETRHRKPWSPWTRRNINTAVAKFYFRSKTRPKVMQNCALWPLMKVLAT